jgi:hypothetical protein
MPRRPKKKNNNSHLLLWLLISRTVAAAVRFLRIPPILLQLVILSGRGGVPPAKGKRVTTPKREREVAIVPYRHQQARRYRKRRPIPPKKFSFNKVAVLVPMIYQTILPVVEKAGTGLRLIDILAGGKRRLPPPSGHSKKYKFNEPQYAEDGEVVKVKLLTGTLYLHRGQNRRVEFVRRV